VTILKQLIRYRKASGFSQSDIAKRMKVSRQQVNNLESGRQGNPTILTVEKYLKAIKINRKQKFILVI
jgi:transcriptional regulator with XRE-family HTH domain